MKCLNLAKRLSRKRATGEGCHKCCCCLLFSYLQVSFELTTKDLEYVGLDLRPVLESGVFLFGVGPASDCRADPDSCTSLTVALSDAYQPACQVIVVSYLGLGSSDITRNREGIKALCCCRASAKFARLGFRARMFSLERLGTLLFLFTPPVTLENLQNTGTCRPPLQKGEITHHLHARLTRHITLKDG